MKRYKICTRGSTEALIEVMGVNEEDAAENYMFALHDDGGWDSGKEYFLRVENDEGSVQIMRIYAELHPQFYASEVR